MRIELPKLQNNDKKAKKLKIKGLLKGWKDIKKVLHYLNLSYIPKIFHSKLINKYHNNLLAENFEIKKT